MKVNYYLFLLLGALLTSCSGPKSIFSIEKQGDKAPLRIDLVNDSQDAESYEWDFGDGNISNDSIANHRYFKSGRYKVKLKATKGKKSSITEQEIIVNPPDECLIHISTSKGDMIARLYDETAKHRDNFIKLANEKYFDSLLFHRVIEGFMIQGGDPNSKGASANTPLGGGGPSYQIDAEFRTEFAHVKGALAAARTGDASNPERKSSGSQFYIVHGRPVTAQQLEQISNRKGINYSPDLKSQYIEVGGTPNLDQGYTVFGIVIEGLDVIDKIATTETASKDRPVEDIVMKISVIK